MKNRFYKNLIRFFPHLLFFPFTLGVLVQKKLRRQIVFGFSVLQRQESKYFWAFSIARASFTRLVLLLFLGGALVGCTCSGGKNRTDFELFHDMLKQQHIKAQEGDEKGTFMRVPPENTRARNHKYYPYKEDPEGAEQNLINPFSNQFSPELIGIGKRQYERACIYCHGGTGKGEGTVARKMIIKPPSLLEEKAINYSDGRIYHIIHEGQGVMGSHRKQVRGEKERWALVNYIRMLQKQALQEEIEKAR